MQGSVRPHFNILDESSRKHYQISLLGFFLEGGRICTFRLPCIRSACKKLQYPQIIPRVARGDDIQLCDQTFLSNTRDFNINRFYCYQVLNGFLNICQEYSPHVVRDAWSVLVPLPFAHLAIISRKRGYRMNVSRPILPNLKNILVNHQFETDRSSKINFCSAPQILGFGFLLQTIFLNGS